jgi:hypothetical protein
LGVAGCSSSPAPSAPSPVSQAGPGLIPLSSVSGYVMDSGFRSIAEARVDVVDGVHAGAATTADAAGKFSLSGPFDRTTRFRATKAGHIAITEVAPSYCRGEECFGSLFFLLPVDGPSVNLIGDYTLTFVADAACVDFPANLRTRSYAAAVVPNPTSVSLAITVTGATFLGNASRFTIGVAGDYVAFSLSESAAIVEQLPGNAFIAFNGDAAVTVEPGTSTISAPFHGSIDHCVTQSGKNVIYGCGVSEATGLLIPEEIVAHAVCASPNNRIILTRR